MATYIYIHVLTVMLLTCFKLICHLCNFVIIYLKVCSHQVKIATDLLPTGFRLAPDWLLNRKLV